MLLKFAFRDFFDGSILKASYRIKAGLTASTTKEGKSNRINLFLTHFFLLLFSLPFYISFGLLT